MQTLLSENEDIKKETESLSAAAVPDPSKVLAHLNSAIAEKFPPLLKTSYSVKYVPKALEEFSSPAFYLTPPIDTLSPNIIYINQSSKTSALERFTTLAHEGFPGHLYQTLYFSHEDVPLIRHALNFSGYVEGWATFVEAKSYDYAAKYLNLNPKLTQAMWLNRSVTLCLYSILDMGIHYRGWNIETVSKLLSSFGLTDENIQKEIFQYIIENPANYLKYYLGYINLIDLEEKVRTENPNAFSEKGFHRKLLEIGPAQFPIIQKYM